MAAPNQSIARPAKPTYGTGWVALSHLNALCDDIALPLTSRPPVPKPGFESLGAADACLDFTDLRWLFAGMKVKTRRASSSRAKARNGRRVSAANLPRFRDVIKSLSGIMEGPPDLSSREGFGPTKVSR
jgi:hypothetical protein